MDTFYPLYSVAYGAGTFVAVGVGRPPGLSADGTNWTVAPFYIGGYSIAHGNGLFVAARNNYSPNISTSPDGLTWTDRDSGVAALLGNIFYAEGLFIAAGRTQDDQDVVLERLNPANPVEYEPVVELSSEEMRGKSIVIVDDVANTGRTIFYAVQPLLKVVPKKVEVAVLVDRQHKSFPVKADYVGLSLATTLRDAGVAGVARRGGTRAVAAALGCCAGVARIARRGGTRPVATALGCRAGIARSIP